MSLKHAARSSTQEKRCARWSLGGKILNQRKCEMIIAENNLARERIFGMIKGSFNDSQLVRNVSISDMNPKNILPPTSTCPF